MKITSPKNIEVTNLSILTPKNLFCLIPVYGITNK